MYSCVDGTPDDFYLVHLGSRAHGGAGARLHRDDVRRPPTGASRPGCAGMYEPSTCRGVETDRRLRAHANAGEDRAAARPRGPERLDAARLGGRRRAAARRQLAADRALGDRVRAEQSDCRAAMTPRRHGRGCATTSCARRGVGAACGFDWLELHCAHGYLLSSVHLPADQPPHRRVRRVDSRTAAAIRSRSSGRCAPSGRRISPMSVRISAHDWAHGGNTPDDAVVIARLFKEAGADLIDVSSGQTTRDAKPVYGRMYQTPFSDRIRNEVGIATMAVGAIFEPDHVNSIHRRGARRSLCARPAASRRSLLDTARRGAIALRQRAVAGAIPRGARSAPAQPCPRRAAGGRRA